MWKFENQNASIDILQDESFQNAKMSQFENESAPIADVRFITSRTARFYVAHCAVLRRALRGSVYEVAHAFFQKFKNEPHN